MMGGSANVNILMLTHVYPYPPDSGGLIVTYNVIKHEYNMGNKVIIVTFHDRDIHTPLDEIADVRIVVKNTQNTLPGLIRGLFSFFPYTLSKYRSRKAVRLIDRILREETIDLVDVDHLHMAVYARHIRKIRPEIPLMLREHNVETTIMERFYQQQRNPFIKLYAWLQYLKLRAYESKAVSIFDSCLMLTENDHQRLTAMNPGINAVTISAGVDTHKYAPLQTPELDMSLVFLGTLSWLPNLDGLKWFIEDIFDRIRQEIPEVKLYIAGKDPNEQAKAFHNGRNIFVLGYVEDEREYIAQGNVFIVPLRIGGGMRIKILNAMSMGRSIVSTAIGAEGIDLENRRDIIIADKEGEFAKEIVNLLKNKSARDVLGRSARENVLNNYSWEALLKKSDFERVKLTGEK